MGKVVEDSKPPEADAAKTIQGVIRARNAKRVQEKAAKKIQGALRDRRHTETDRRSVVGSTSGLPPGFARSKTEQPSQAAARGSGPDSIGNQRDPALMRKMYSDARRAFVSKDLSDEDGSALRKASRAILKAAEGAVRQRSVIDVLTRKKPKVEIDTDAQEMSEMLLSMFGQDASGDEELPALFLSVFQEMLTQAEAGAIGEQLKSLARRMSATEDAFSCLRRTYGSRLDDLEGFQKKFALQMQEASDISDLFNLEVSKTQKQLSSLMGEARGGNEAPLPKNDVTNSSDGAKVGGLMALASEQINRDEETDGVVKLPHGEDSAECSRQGGGEPMNQSETAEAVRSALGEEEKEEEGRVFGSSHAPKSQLLRLAILHIVQATCVRPLQLLMTAGKEINAMSVNAELPGVDLASGFRESLVHAQEAQHREEKALDIIGEEEDGEVDGEKQNKDLLVEVTEADTSESFLLADDCHSDSKCASSVSVAAGAASQGASPGGHNEASSAAHSRLSSKGSKGLRMRNRISLRHQDGVDRIALLASTAATTSAAVMATDASAASAASATAAAELRALWHYKGSKFTKLEVTSSFAYAGSGGEMPKHIGDTEIAKRAGSAAPNTDWHSIEAPAQVLGSERHLQKWQGHPSNEPLNSAQELQPSSLTCGRVRAGLQPVGNDVSVGRMGLDSIEAVRDRRRRIANGEANFLAMPQRPLVPEPPKGENPRPFLPFGRPMSRTTPTTPRTTRLRFLPPVDATPSCSLAPCSPGPSRCSAPSGTETDVDGSPLARGFRRDPRLAAMWRRRGGLISVDEEADCRSRTTPRHIASLSTARSL